ncbi:hypothetical protein [Niallia taxi]|nr:hypothetical protein [Niallia taxi]
MKNKNKCIYSNRLFFEIGRLTDKSKELKKVSVDLKNKSKMLKSIPYH